MKKLNIKSTIYNIDDKMPKTNTCLGNMDNNKIFYDDDDISVTILIIDNKIKMVRNGNDYKLDMTFILKEKTYGIYQIDELGDFNVEIFTNKLDIKPKKIYIEYTLKVESEQLGKFNFNLDYEVI